MCVCVCLFGGGGGACTMINIRSLSSSTFSCEKWHSREDEEFRNYRKILSCIRALLMVSLLMGGGGGCSNTHCFLGHWKKFWLNAGVTFQENFISLTWHPACFRGPQARVVDGWSRFGEGSWKIKPVKLISDYFSTDGYTGPRFIRELELIIWPVTLMAFVLNICMCVVSLSQPNQSYSFVWK